MYKGKYWHIQGDLKVTRLLSDGAGTRPQLKPNTVPFKYSSTDQSKQKGPVFSPHAH